MRMDEPANSAIISEWAETFPIQPEDIDLSKGFMDTFGHSETEVSVYWLVRFATERGAGWAPFTANEINAFYEANSEYKGYTFNQLIEPGTAFFIREGNVPQGGGWIISELPELDVDEWRDSPLHFTMEFVDRCYRNTRKAVELIRTK